MYARFANYVQSKRSQPYMDSSSGRIAHADPHWAWSANPDFLGSMLEAGTAIEMCRPERLQSFVTPFRYPQGPVAGIIR